MTETAAQKVSAMVDRSRLAMATAKKAGRPLPPGFLDKVVEVCADIARRAIVAGDFTSAEAVLAKALDFAPRHPLLAIEQASLLLKTNRPRAALPLVEKALAARPADAQAHSLAGYTLQLLWRLPEALSHFNKAVELQPDNDGFRKALASALAAAGRLGEAADVWRALVARHPDDPDYIHGLAIAMTDGGEVEEARALFQRVITLAPGHGPAHRMLGLTSHYRPGDPQIAAMETALSRAPGDKVNQCDLRFGLYAAYDKLGDHDQAFAHLKEGNRLLGETKGYSDGAEFALIRLARDFFTEAFVRTLPQSTSKEAPIFIVGMPRSGSTLAEQILASHPDVGAAGEVPILQGIVEHDLFDQKAKALRADFASASTTWLDSLATAYIQALRGVSPAARRLTDKYLSNFVWIGLIRMLFPRAKVIHCVRDPLANGFSIYSNYFLTSGLKYKARLEDIGRYYLAYADLMRHWHNCFPRFIHDLSYEKLTMDQEAETRRLLDYCGLDWNPACLNFHETKRAVKTASFNQVRKPMYSGADRKTANYRHHLTPLIHILETGRTGSASPALRLVREVKG